MDHQHTTEILIKLLRNKVGTIPKNNPEIIDTIQYIINTLDTLNTKHNNHNHNNR